MVVVGIAAAGVFALTGPSSDALVVYCAHDLMFSEQILDRFEAETGIPVVIVGDTEATKSLGLVQRIIRERERPRCDVFWNNQVLGTIQLQEEGLLEPYQGSGFERIPAEFKAPDGAWTGFAGRLRVWIVNTNAMPATQIAVDEALARQDLKSMAFAEPLYGTTLSHWSLMWDRSGGDELQRWHHDLASRGCRVVSGNATVKNLVAEGICEFGMTDTDDFFVARDAAAPVEMLPIRVDGQTICIPNSVAIIRGTDQLDRAQQLVDFLLSEQIELELARSQSRQIPLGPVDRAELPEEVVPLADWAEESADLTNLGAARQACLEWLLLEYAP